MTTPHLFYREIPLTQGKVSIVDVADYDWLMRYKWQATFDPCTQSWYAHRHYRVAEGFGRKSVSMHRFIFGLTPGDPRTVDHVNTGETLLNCRYNLRIATQSQQAMNRRVNKLGPSGLRGVRWHVKGQNWEARITLHRKTISLGVFPTKEEAHKAYREIAAIAHGEFAKTG